MEYNEEENRLLDIMKRKDFKAISKNEVISLANGLANIRPEVAKEIVAQFPELSNLIGNEMNEYHNILSDIIDSDDDSLNRFYNLADKEMDNTSAVMTDYYQLANDVRCDISKCLSEPGLSLEEKQELLDREERILEKVSKKEEEIRQEKREIVNEADKKDSEKRKFDWGIIETASCVVLFGIGIGLTALGGEIKIPDFKK